MSKVDRLVRSYAKFCGLPWERAMAGPQRVWFVVYDPRDERRMRARMPEFALVTEQAGHGWRHIDLAGAFGRWFAGLEYREAYLECPEDLETAMPDFEVAVVEQIKEALVAEDVDADSVVAISGVGSLFGFTKTATLVQAVEPHIRGRLAVFFPGTHEDNNYRLFDARDGWNYMAIPITVHEGAESQ